MKPLHYGVVFILLILFSVSTTAQVKQDSRKSLFRSSSARLPATISELEKAFTLPAGSDINLRFYNLSFIGKVVSSVKRYHNLHSVIIKSSELDNSLLSISKRTNKDKSVTYIGRIINEKYADAYELVQNDDGTYLFQKLKTDALIQDY